MHCTVELLFAYMIFVIFDECNDCSVMLCEFHLLEMMIHISFEAFLILFPWDIAFNHEDFIKKIV